MLHEPGAQRAVVQQGELHLVARHADAGGQQLPRPAQVEVGEPHALDEPFLAEPLEGARGVDVGGDAVVPPVFVFVLVCGLKAKKKKKAKQRRQTHKPQPPG